MDKIIKIYLDVCTICRPFDDHNQTRIRMERDAYYLILGALQSHVYQMVISPVHSAEINAISEHYERLEVLAILNKFGVQASFNKTLGKDRAEQLYSFGFGIADAAHIAIAEQSADYFITCDDKLIGKCNKYQIDIKVINPIDFCLKEHLE